MYLEAQLFLSGSATTDAWNAIYDDAKSRNFGTSKADIDSYASAGASVAAGAACVAASQPELSPICAEIGGIIGGAVADFVQNVGAALFGGGASLPDFTTFYNARAAAMIASVVKATGAQKSADPQAVAGIWSANVNSVFASAVVGLSTSGHVITIQGKPVAGYPGLVAPFDSGGKVESGFINTASGIDTFIDTTSGVDWASSPLYQKGKLPPPGFVALWVYLVPSLNQAMVRGTQQTVADDLAVLKSSTASTAVKLGVAGGVGAAIWYFRQPIIQFGARVLRALGV